ncbi:dihydroorotase, partial [Methylobacterium trifolii]
MSAHVLLTNAHLCDPASGREGPGSILIRDGRIGDVAWGPRPGAPEDCRTIDCGGHVLAPGLIDMRAFVGEPGAEHRETLASAS